MKKFKTGIDIPGWATCVGIVAILWAVCLWESMHDYFIPNAIEFTKLIVALSGTVIIWLLHLLIGGREWLESQKAAIEWQAAHDLAMMEKMDKLVVGKLQEIHNIVGDGGSGTGSFGNGEVIGED